MAIVGSFVRYAKKNTFGIVIGWDEDNEGNMLVRIWSAEYGDYRTFTIHPRHLMAIEPFDMIEAEPKDSKGFWEDLKAISLELSLQTKDKEWFTSIIENRQMQEEGERL